MSHDPSSDPADARLAALYQAHAAQAEQPSAASDARILALAREAVARPAAPPAASPAASGWRSWLKSSWFGPGLAFATVAALSIVVVSLMPKEDLSVERAITTAPDTPPPSVSPAAPVASGAAPAPAASVATPAPMHAPAPSAESAAASSATSESGAKQAPDRPSKPKLARTNEPARPPPQRSAPITTAPAAPPAPAALPAPAAIPAPAPAAASVASNSKAMPQRGEAGSAPAPAPTPTPATKVGQPNPFPAHSPPAATDRAYQAAAAAPAVATPAPRAAPAAAAAADAGPAQHVEKPSLLSEPTESRMGAKQPITEAHDSAPTYLNEAQSSIPLPYAYTTPRAPARDAAPGFGAAAGSLAGGVSAPQQLSATRKADVAERRAADKSASPAAAAPATATAPPLRDPAEWVKAIQKLRTEGKSEQVTKELTEFRRQYPLYPLPDELKQLIIDVRTNN